MVIPFCKQNGGGEVAVGFEEQRHCSWLYEGITLGEGKHH